MPPAARSVIRLITVLAALCPIAASAQLHNLPLVAPVRSLVDDVTHTTGDLTQSVTALADARVDRIDRLVRAHPDRVELDDTGQPARAHEVLLLDPDPAALQIAAQAGFALIEQSDAGGLGVKVARLAAPRGARLASAIGKLRRLLPDRTITADALHFPAGTVGKPASGHGGAGAPASSAGVGMIDGGVAASPRIIAQAGFAAGAPHRDGHAQAIASLLAGAGIARIFVADVYGSDPAGGNALAIARALGWMQERGVRVVSISLVGPANPLLARVIAAVQTRGVLVVAAVGNDGAAAPPAYPASYPGVIAVTGVDGRNHVLFEAGHALHIEYAAPGADLTAIDLTGRARHLRGTSFAAPLVAARLALLGADRDARAAQVRADAEAVLPGPRTGHGVLCDTCRQGI